MQYALHQMSLQLSSSVEINVFFRQQLYWHIVGRIHLLMKHYRLEKRINAVVTLHVCMLGYQKRNGAFSQTLSVFFYHIISHYLYTSPIGLEQELTNDMSLGAEG